MRAVPFAKAHEEAVDTLVLEIDSGNSLDDVVVIAGDVELDLGTGVGVSQTQGGLAEVTRLKTLEELLSV